MSEIKLNLARKWRSKTFDEIIGQDLSIRMLKNGLFLKQFFPVYLISGQRGCGKTSTARIFAAALNCEQLEAFRENPQKTTIPCLTCKSCVAMQKGTHPDFIEIDAASHTGVDNVRYIIDSATLMPLMGNKKIYLIDEAHMLSKSAFNAFLKILEEPPVSVLFILATTDPQKIIETVRSRCFQLFFNPVETNVLMDRLRSVCQKERIAYDDAGLEMIVKQTEGSVRDALNMLEQVRFSSSSITAKSVRDVLGYLDEELLIKLFEHTLLSRPSALLAFIQEHAIQSYSAPLIWTQLFSLVRATLWLKYDVKPDHFMAHHEALRSIAQHCSVKQLQNMLEIMYEHHDLFTKATAKYDVLEMVLLTICQQNGSDPEGGPSPSSAQVPHVVAPVQEHDECDEEFDEDDEEEQDEDDEDDLDDPISMRWEKFITKVTALEDPLVTSIFTQGVAKGREGNKLLIEFSKQFVFFQDWLAQTRHEWEPILKELFGAEIILEPSFTGAAPERKIAEPVAVQAPKPIQKPAKEVPVYQRKKSFGNYTKKISLFAHEKPIDISDEDAWKKTHMLLRYMPGSVTDITVIPK